MPLTTSHPTLWRTCRALANHTRILLLAQLVRKQPQSVTELAELCSLTLPVASQSLRALEARGLLQVRRIRRRVEYRFPARQEAGALAELVAALQPMLRREPLPVGLIVKLATAFTHPTRIQIHELLQTGPKSELEIQTALRLSTVALWRHLRKLSVRGFVRYDEAQRSYQTCPHPDRLGRALGKLATTS